MRSLWMQMIEIIIFIFLHAFLSLSLHCFVCISPPILIPSSLMFSFYFTFLPLPSVFFPSTPFSSPFLSPPLSFPSSPIPSLSPSPPITSTSPPFPSLPPPVSLPTPFSLLPSLLLSSPSLSFYSFPFLLTSFLPPPNRSSLCTTMIVTSASGSCVPPVNPS